MNAKMKVTIIFFILGLSLFGLSHFTVIFAEDAEEETISIDESVEPGEDEFDFDESALTTGAAMMTAAIMDILS